MRIREPTSAAFVLAPLVQVQGLPGHVVPEEELGGLHFPRRPLGAQARRDVCEGHAGAPAPWSCGFALSWGTAACGAQSGAPRPAAAAEVAVLPRAVRWALPCLPMAIGRRQAHPLLGMPQSGLQLVRSGGARPALSSRARPSSHASHGGFRGEVASLSEGVARVMPILLPPHPSPSFLSHSPHGPLASRQASLCFGKWPQHTRFYCFF